MSMMNLWVGFSASFVYNRSQEIFLRGSPQSQLIIASTSLLRRSQSSRILCIRCG